MVLKTIFFILFSVLLVACSEVKQRYRDTTELETPPRLAISEQSAGTAKNASQKKKEEFVFLDDVETPPVLKIKKLLDRSWDLIGQALAKKKIEITDKNREKGIYYVKYDASEDTDSNVFGNVRLFFFEDQYQEQAYKISLVWHDTETEVRVQMIDKQEPDVEDEDEEPADGSAKLIQALYDEIEARKTEE